MNSSPYIQLYSATNCVTFSLQMFSMFWIIACYLFINATVWMKNAGQPDLTEKLFNLIIPDEFVQNIRLLEKGDIEV